MQISSDAARARAEALFKPREPNPTAAQTGTQDQRSMPRVKRQQLAYLRALRLDAGRRRSQSREGSPRNMQ